MASRGTYVIRDGALVPKGEAIRLAPRPARSSLPSPMIVSDHIAPGRSQLDGRTYDSRSQLFASYRDYAARTGREVEVVGDQVHHLMRDVPETADEAAIDRSIKTALEMHGA